MSHGHVSPAELQAAPPMMNAAQTDAAEDGKLIIEDGWVFREHHGKYVECICRSHEMPALHQAPPATT